MTKKDMAKASADAAGVAHGQALEILQMVLDGITEALLTGQRIELRNFGIFEVKKRRARQARNPKTGASVFVPAKAVVTFKPGLTLGSRVSQLPIVADQGPNDTVGS